MDLMWRDSMCCPTEGEYIEMVKGSELHSESTFSFCDGMLRDQGTVTARRQVSHGLLSHQGRQVRAMFHIPFTNRVLRAFHIALQGLYAVREPFGSTLSDPR
jgi:hypothetical protein